MQTDAFRGSPNFHFVKGPLIDSPMGLLNQWSLYKLFSLIDWFVEQNIITSKKQYNFVVRIMTHVLTGRIACPELPGNQCSILQMLSLLTFFKIMQSNLFSKIQGGVPLGICNLNLFFFPISNLCSSSMAIPIIFITLSSVYYYLSTTRKRLILKILWSCFIESELVIGKSTIMMFHLENRHQTVVSL